MHGCTTAIHNCNIAVHGYTVVVVVVVVAAAAAAAVDSWAHGLGNPSGVPAPLPR